MSEQERLARRVNAGIDGLADLIDFLFKWAYRLFIIFLIGIVVFLIAVGIQYQASENRQEREVSNRGLGVVFLDLAGKPGGATASANIHGHRETFTRVPHPDQGAAI